jgi:hypothetical protein
MRTILPLLAAIVDGSCLAGAASRRPALKAQRRRCSRANGQPSNGGITNETCLGAGRRGPGAAFAFTFGP